MAFETTDRTIDSANCLFADLGVVTVSRAETLMQITAEKIVGHELPDIVYFLAHPPTVAVGVKDRRAERPRDLLVSPERLRSEGIELARSIRGGGATYHWPGQIVCYPVLHLKPCERSVTDYMTGLEEVGIMTLQLLGLIAVRRRDTPAHIGLWVDGRKIVSMGIRVSRWVTSFGFAINLDGDLACSQYVRPCGLDGVRLTSVELELGHAPPRERINEFVKQSFASVFRRRLKEAPPEVISVLAELEGQAP